MAASLGDLTRAGVAIWLDDLSRAWLATGSLARLIRDWHVVGVTTNPTIVYNAISGSDHYDWQIRDLGARGVGAPRPCAYSRFWTSPGRATCCVPSTTRAGE